jgi:CHAT domain-containing protein/Tfp pilus assembly protein PilF
LRGQWNGQGGAVEDQRHYVTVGLPLLLLCLITACGLACRRQESPQAALEHAYKAFVHGDLKQSQEEADRGYQRFRTSSLVWAWKFRILEANSLLWRGMYQQVLTLLGSPPNRPDNREFLIEVLAIEGAAHARLHQFPEAADRLGQATQACELSEEATCGDVMRAQGILAIQHGQVDAATHFFERSLQFARSRNDRFLEVTSLLNLGLASLQAEHFDEAIDWTDSAYQAATTLGADGEAQTALGNLGWAYYKLGDSERSLDLSLEAERRASQMGRIITQLYWTTNVGYVYAGRGDLLRAKESYLKALDLATRIDSKEGFYNAYRALALCSVASGESEAARRYANEAISIARADNNRINELYPLLVEGLIAAQSNHDTAAERIFREVEEDPNSNASLRWRSEHGLARLYDKQKRTAKADRGYRTALATFEAARSSLQRNEAKLPFFNNASLIYDDYIGFLVAQGKANAALRLADYSRARTLAEGLGLLSQNALRSSAPLKAQAVAHGAQANILFYWLGARQSFLWAITAQTTRLFSLPPGAEIEAAAQRYRRALTGPLDVIESADPDGRWLYANLLAPAVALLPKGSRVCVISDGALNNLNFDTLVVPEPTPHYWVEDATVVNASSLRVLAVAGSLVKKRSSSLLLVGNSIAPNDKYPELPQAQAQMDGVATHFDAASRRVLAREQATPAAYLSSNPAQFSYIHFVAHGTASRLSPLDSAIILSKGSAESDSFKLYARDIIRQPLRADVVTISSCYGAGERTYAGEGLVGLSWAFLRAGAHNVVAALWEATDASTEQLMEKFYEELEKGATPDVALHSAKLFLLKNTAFHNPFYWAPFQIYAGS